MCIIAGGMLRPCVVGFLTSAVCGYLAISTVRLLVKHDTFRWFAVYCLAVGLITIFLNLI